MPKRKRPEDAIQRAVFQHLDQRGTPGIIAFHPANGGGRSKIEGAILKGLGVKPGIPDVFVIIPEPLLGARLVVLELKAPGGRLSKAQSEMLQRLDAAGVDCFVCDNLDVAIEALEDAGALRGKANI